MALTWLDDHDFTVIGNLPIEEASKKLREVGEDKAADQLDAMQRNATRSVEPGKQRWPFQNELWQHTSYICGYVAPISRPHEPQPIVGIETINPDESLRNARLKITLNRLQATSYPGRGAHSVLLHFVAQNQTSDQVELARFNATYRVQEGDSAGVQGYPIFIGLGVGQEGILLECVAINVRNEQDEVLLRTIEDKTVRTGLHLLSMAQPALVPFSEMAFGLVKAIATRRRNVPVHAFSLGLDFGTIAGRGRLAEGAYLVVQKPENIPWDWDQWIYLPAISRVVNRRDYQKLLPYNYLMFGISRC